jgi:hypothetical protein
MIPDRHLEPVRPLAQSVRNDFPGLGDELVPCIAAMIDEIVVGLQGQRVRRYCFP